MSISMPKYKIKVICKTCGWHLIVARHVMGHVTSFDVFSAILNLVPLCGRCGSRDLMNCAPTILEHVNPLENARKLAYVVQLPSLLKKYPGDEEAGELVSKEN
jgi:hypothetical protein